MTVLLGMLFAEVTVRSFGSDSNFFRVSVLYVHGVYSSHSSIVSLFSGESSNFRFEGRKT